MVRLTNETPMPVPIRTRLTRTCGYEVPACELGGQEQPEGGERRPDDHQRFGRQAVDEHPAGELGGQEHHVGVGRNPTPVTREEWP